MRSILIVDDEQSFLLSLELVLKAEGFKVLTATSGEEALIFAKDAHPDLILLDIMMPGMGGLEALKFLKSHPDLKQIPVILMSGARPLVRQSEYKWVEFLFKPFDAKQLIAAVKAHT
jgi:CheY-like chemotaxis protein